MTPWYRRRPITAALDIVVVYLLALPTWRPLLQGRLIGTHDGYFHLYRLFELDRALRSGDVYPRWAPDFALGYGYPVFNYYSPLMLYLALPWRLLGAGLIVSLGLAQVAAVLVAAVSMYLLAGDLFGRAAACVAAVLYATLPYLLVDVYVRGAIAETLALALMPLVAWTLRSVVLKPTSGRVAAAGLSVAALILAHNITALLALPVLGLFALLALTATGRRPVAAVAAGLAGAAALGLGLSAVYWLPALIERDLVRNELLTTLFYDFHNHFQPLRELFQRTLWFDYRYDALAGFLFKPGLVQLAVAGVGAALGLARMRIRRRELAFLTVLTIVGLFLLTARSAPLWEALPLLAYAQFPWRMLSLVGFATVLLGAGGIAAVGGSRRRTLLAGALVVPWVAASLWDLRPVLLDLREDEISAGALNRVELDRRLIGTTTIGEYMPRTVSPDLFKGWSAPLGDGASSVRPRAVEPSGSTGLRVAVDAPSGGTLLLDRYAFPGWAASVDGAPAVVGPSAGGRLGIGVPSGAREVVITAQPTAIRTIATSASALFTVVLIALLAARMWRHGRSAVISVAAALATAWLVWPGGSAAAGVAFPRASVGSPIATFEGGPVLLGGRDEGRGEIRLFWTTDAVLPRPLEVALRLLDDRGEVVARRDKPPRYGLRPSSMWRPGAIVEDLADLAAPPDAGIDGSRAYRLVVGLSDDRGYLAPTGGTAVRWQESCPCAAPGPDGVGVVVTSLAAPPSAPAPAPFLSASHTLPLPGPTIAGGRIALTGVKVDVATPEPTVPERVLMRLSSRLSALRRLSLSADAVQSRPGGPAGVLATLDPGGTLVVAPEWRALADVAEDYAVFVHLLDYKQDLVAQDDEWPRRGFSPTSLWHTDQRTPDGYRVRIPPDARPAALTVALGLYRRADFARLPWSGEPVGRDKIVLGRVKIRPLASVATPLGGARATFGGAIELIGLGGVGLDGSTIQPGSTLTVEPRWRSLAPVDRDLTVFVQLLDAGGQLVASGDSQPLGGRYPTSLWEPGERIDDRYQIAVPAGLRGAARLVIGFYRLDNGERLTTADGANAVPLASFSVGP